MSDMRFIPLINSPRLAMVDVEDYERVSALRWRWRDMRRNSGLGYVVVMANTEEGRRVELSLHRLVMKAAKGQMVDHKDSSNTLDCRKSNLRFASAKGNVGNTRKRTGPATSKYKGVSFNVKAGKWVATMRGKRLGSFNAEQNAATAYNQAAKKYFGEFALLNTIPGAVELAA